jgi:hypothetical protein
MHVWRYDAGGLAEVDSLPDLDKTSAIASTTPVIEFCLDETGKRMVCTEWNGPRAGSGLILTLQKNGKWAAGGHGWIS